MPSALIVSQYHTKADLTFLLLPELSFSAGSSRAPRPPEPMLLLRIRLDDFFGDRADDLLKDELATSPSAMFSLSKSPAMMECGMGEGDVGEFACTYQLGQDQNKQLLM